MRQDTPIRIDQIPTNLRVNSFEEARNLISQTKNGDIIALTNKTDLSETFIYQRTGFDSLKNYIEKWDGETYDTSWYRKNLTEFLIHSPAQFAGLKFIIESGDTLEGKTVKLANDIDLQGMEWYPIGSSTLKNKVSSCYDFEISQYNKTFSGIFDGNGFCIHNLYINGDSNCNLVNALFASAKDATFKNIILSDVNIDGKNNFGFFSSLVGYAERCKFINIRAYGMVKAQNCSSICCISQDSVFVRCVNSVNICARSVNGKSIWVGGIVNQIGVSDKSINAIGEKRPSIFIRCSQEGNININASKVSGLYTGQLYANCAYKKETKPYGFVIDRCKIPRDGNIVIEGLDDLSLLKGVFYGSIGGSSNPANYVSSVDDKSDLLCGIIGKTNKDLSVTIKKITSSKEINNMIIAGSLNIMESSAKSNSFMTKDVQELSEKDSIVDLEPFFTFLSTIRS